MLSAIFKRSMLRMMNIKPCSLSNVIPSCIKRPHAQRSMTTGSKLSNNYEGDGKTTVTLLNREYRSLIMVNAFSELGFRLNNGIFVIGPLVAFSKTVLQWNISTFEDITLDTLSLFFLLEPKLDILVIGTGDKRQLPNTDVLKALKSNKISVEILSTEHAISTFNFLNVEGRYVAGAFIPPTKVIMYEDDLKLISDHETVTDLSRSS